MSGQPPLFTVRNKHIASSSKPPTIDGSAGDRYHGYFENEYGEQTLFVFDYQTRTGTLLMGNIGWEEPKTVMNGEMPELMLDENEKLWLKACWNAAVAHQK